MQIATTARRSRPLPAVILSALVLSALTLAGCRRDPPRAPETCVEALARASAGEHVLPWKACAAEGGKAPIH